MQVCCQMSKYLKVQNGGLKLHQKMLFMLQILKQHCVLYSNINIYHDVGVNESDKLSIIVHKKCG